jgi:hypothetical protein
MEKVFEYLHWQLEKKIQSTLEFETFFFVQRDERLETDEQINNEL